MPVAERDNSSVSINGAYKVAVCVQQQIYNCCKSHIQNFWSVQTLGDMASFLNTRHLYFVLFITVMISEQMSDPRERSKVRFQMLNCSVYPAISSIVKGNNFCRVSGCKC